MSEEIRVCSSCWEEDCVCDYEQYIFIDKNIADIILLLNLKGYGTKFCCEGHILPEEELPGSGIMQIYIMFNKRYDMIPEGFTYPKNKNGTDISRKILYKYSKGVLKARIDGKYIPYDLEQDKFEHIEKLREWAESLPEISIKEHPECYSRYMVTGEPRSSFSPYDGHKYKTFKVSIVEKDFEEYAQRIICSCGKVLEVEEKENKIDVYYWADYDLFESHNI